MSLNYKKFRNLEKMTRANDGSRTLFESLAYPEVEEALKDWINLEVGECVLIGGVALSYYVKPRTTQDIDILFLSKENIPTTLPSFKRTRNGAFQHNKTHVEVEVITPSMINISNELAQEIFNSAVISNGIKVASPSGLIASKLNRFNRRDQADIEELIVTQNIDLTKFTLTEEELERYNSIKNTIV